MPHYKIEPQIITVRQDAEQKLPAWVEQISKLAFWVSIALFIKAFADAI